MAKKTKIFWMDRVAICDLFSGNHNGNLMLLDCQPGMKDSAHVREHKEGLIQGAVTFDVDLVEARRILKLDHHVVKQIKKPRP